MSRVRASVAIVLVTAAAACSAAPEGSPKSSGTGSTPTSGTPKGAGSGTTNGDSPDAGAPQGSLTITQSGIITDFNTNQPVSGAIIKAADQTATSGADGSYSLTLKKGEPFALSVASDGYATLLEQETSLQASHDSGSTTIVPQSLAGILTAMLTGYDATLGVLSLAIVPTGSCASEDGATVSVSPAGSAKIAYFDGSLPSTTLKGVKGGNFPSAAIYNVQPGVPLTVTVTHATCKEAAFPIVQGGVEYTGGMSTEAGNVTGFARIFLQ